MNILYNKRYKNFIIIIIIIIIIIYYYLFHSGVLDVYVSGWTKTMFCIQNGLN